MDGSIDGDEAARRQTRWSGVEIVCESVWTERFFKQVQDANNGSLSRDCDWKKSWKKNEDESESDTIERNRHGISKGYTGEMQGATGPGRPIESHLIQWSQAVRQREEASLAMALVVYWLHAFWGMRDALGHGGLQLASDSPATRDSWP